jgi:polyhydroxyalkanoate synthesis regulator phasin
MAKTFRQIKSEVDLKLMAITPGTDPAVETMREMVRDLADAGNMLAERVTELEREVQRLKDQLRNSRE